MIRKLVPDDKVSLDAGMPTSIRDRAMTILYILLGLVALALVLVLVVLFAQVEDWSRDLTTNVAVTDENAGDERLRPVHSTLPVEGLANRIEKAARDLPRWTLTERRETEGAIELHFVRSTAVLRFRDDIRVRIEPTGDGGSLLTAESRSRVGKGDLGQNPRNLRELLEAVRNSPK